jgi:hypothetical protein
MRLSTRLTAIALSATALTAIGTGTAHAASGPSTADVKAWKSSASLCMSAPDEVTHKACRIGTLMNARHRSMTPDDIVNGSLKHATVKLTTSVRKPTVADKRVMAQANIDCEPLTNGSKAWKGCITGAFALEAAPDRIVTSTDWFVIKVRAKGAKVTFTKRAYLHEASHKIA